MSEVTAAVLHALETTNIVAEGACLLLLPDDLKLAVKFPAASVWHPYAEQASLWSHRGHRVLSDFEAEPVFRTIILICPKQKEETLFLVARALEMLAPDGVLIAAADNLAGGKTLVKLLGSLTSEVDDISKHKCRVVWTKSSSVKDNDAIKRALNGGAIRIREDGFESQPGLFSWSRLDKGTNVLLHHLPFSFAGVGADFGCGVGVLGARLLQRHSDIQKLYCIDNDSRAVVCTRRNLAKWQSKCDFMWADVRKLPHVPLLDFVVMNPPFHQGRLDSNLLGQNFIRSAAAHLKPGGMLVFVANLHLPYEALLHQEFAMQRLVSEQDGFKVIEAIK